MVEEAERQPDQAIGSSFAGIAFMASNNPNPSQLELPKSVLGRIACVIACLPLLAFSAMFSYAYLCGILSGRRVADSLVGQVFHHLAGVIFESLFLFSLLGLIWSVATPAWIGQLFQWAAAKLILVLALFALFSLPFVIWLLFKA